MSEIIRCIRDNTSDKAIGIEAEFEVNVIGWGTQRLESLLHLIKKLELDK